MIVAGDVCARYEMASPEFLTVFAYNDGEVLSMGEVEGYSIDTVADRDTNALDVLSEQWNSHGSLTRKTGDGDSCSSPLQAHPVALAVLIAWIVMRT
jgi:hypothetical protein